MKNILLAAALIIGGAEASLGADPLDKLQSLDELRYHELQSVILERPLHLFVRLPPAYVTAGVRYPAVYLLDGGITFPLLASFQHYLAFGGEVPDAILVGVSYGSDTFEQGNFRGSDFTAPAPDRAHYGGAPKFQRVLEEEILPLIEARYPADPARRVIFGQSLGGQFVLFTALTKPGLFWGHIASNPALHRNLPFFLDFSFAESEPAQSRLFVSSGADDDPVFREPALQWIEHWERAAHRPWQLKTATLEGETHFSAAPAAYRQGMRWLFPGETPAE